MPWEWARRLAGPWPIRRPNRLRLHAPPIEEKVKSKISVRDRLQAQADLANLDTTKSKRLYNQITNPLMTSPFRKSTASIAKLNLTTADLDERIVYLVGVAIFNRSLSSLVSPWRLLVLKRSATDRMFPNFWCIPGGHVDNRETIRQAIRRETFEETGLIVDDIAAEFQEMHWQSKIGQHLVQLNFVVTVNSASSIRLNSEEHSDWKCAKQEDVIPLPMSEGMAEVYINAFRFAEYELGNHEWRRNVPRYH